MRSSTSTPDSGSFAPMGYADTMIPAELELAFAETHFAGPGMLPSTDLSSRIEETGFQFELAPHGEALTGMDDNDEAARAHWGAEETTSVHSVDNFDALVASGEFGATLNSAVDQLHSLFPNLLVDGLKSRDLHPDILRIADKIQDIVLNAVYGDFMQELALPFNQAQDGVVRLGESAAELLDINTSTDRVRDNIAQVRLRLKLLGQLVAKQMLRDGSVTKALRQVEGRYMRQQMSEIDAEYAEVVGVERQRTATKKHVDWVLAEMDAQFEPVSDFAQSVPQQQPVQSVAEAPAVKTRKPRNPSNEIYLVRKGA